MKSVFTLFILLFSLASFGASRIDSLQSILDGVCHDSTRIKTTLVLANELYSSDQVSALLMVNDAANLAVESKMYKLAATSYNQLGLFHYFGGQLNESKLCFAKSKGYFDLVGEKRGSANAVNNIGVIAYEQGSYSEALTNFNIALEVRKFLRDSAAISVSYNNIGNVHKDLGELDVALNYYHQSVSIKQKLDDEYGLAMTLNNMGLVFIDKEFYDSATYYFNKSIAIKKNINDDHGLGMSYANLGITTMRQGDYTSSNDYLDSSLQIRIRLNDDYGVLQTNICRGDLKIYQGDYPEAITIGNEQLIIAIELDARVQEKEIYNILYQAYKGENDFETALEYYIKYDELNDSLLYNNQLIEAKQFETTLKVDEKDETIKELKALSSEPKSIWKRGGTELIVFIILIIIIVLYLRKKGAKTEDNEINIRDLFLTRVLMAATLLVYPIVGLLRASSPDSIYDPFYERIIVSTAILLPFLGTFFSKTIRKTAFFLIGILFYIVSFHLIYLTFQNQFQLAYFIDFMVIQGAITVIFRKTKGTIIYLCAVFISIIIAYHFCVDPQVDQTAVYTSLGLVMLVSVLVQITNINVNKQLKFSNQVINQVDALVMVSNNEGRYIYAANSVKSLLGYSIEDVLEDNFLSIAGLSNKEAIDLKKYLIDVAIGAREPKEDSLVKHKTKSGDTKWIYWKDKRISNDRVLSVGQDVTSLRELQAEVEINEANFRQINESVKDVFFLYNIVDKKYEYISPSCAAVVGAPQEFFYSGKTHTTTFVLPEDQAKVFEAEKTVNSGQSYDIEYRMMINNEVRWLRERSYPIFDAENNVIRNSGIVQDVTVRKLNEEQTKILSLVTSASPNYVVIAEPEAGIQWVNKAFTKTFGYTLDEVIGKQPSEVMATSPEIIAQINETVIKNNQPFKKEMIHYKKSGEIVYAEIDIIPMLNVEGIMEKYCVLGIDITERHNFEQTLIVKERALAASEENFRELIRSVTVVFWLNDLVEKKIVFVSQSYQDIFGIDSQVLIDDPRSWSDPIHPEDKQRVIDNFAKKAHYGGFNEEYRIIKPDGEERWIKTRAFPIADDDGVVVKLSGVSEDITDKKNSEIAIKTFSEQLEIIHSIENAILTSESTEEIIYNTLQKALDTLPIFRASLALFDYEDNSFYAYARRNDDTDTATDGRKFDLKDFQMLDVLKETKSHYFKDIREKKVRSATDDLLIKEGATLTLMSPMFHGQDLIGSLNVCFYDSNEERNHRYIKITNEVAKGLAFAIFQSRLKENLAISTAETEEIAQRLEIIHSIENTILTSESTESIIYNTLQQAIDKMPIIRASLALFDFTNQTFDSFAVRADKTTSDTNKKTYSLKEFGSLPFLQASKSHYFQDVRKRENKTETDRILIEEGAVFILMAPLYHGDTLIGSLNIGFGDNENQSNEQIIQITNEVAKGLAFAIQQSRLKDTIQHYNKEVTSSIDYALMIQQAHIPEDLNKYDNCQEEFIIYRPKDIVSGDFYWTAKEGDNHIFVIGDCTGHGVPGAFMTIIGINALQNIVSVNGITSPKRILEELNLSISLALKSDKTYQLRDGMDVAVCSYNAKTKKVLYGGARRPIVVATTEGTQVIEGSKLSIGEEEEEFNETFSEVEIDHKKSNSYYMFSDGFTDQFGGEKRRKFSKRRTVELIGSVQHLSLKEQKVKIEQVFNEWQGQVEQIDDIVFGAFKLKD